MERADRLSGLGDDRWASVSAGQTVQGDAGGEDDGGFRERLVSRIDARGFGTT